MNSGRKSIQTTLSSVSAANVYGTNGSPSHPPQCEDLALPLTADQRLGPEASGLGYRQTEGATHCRQSQMQGFLERANQQGHRPMALSVNQTNAMHASTLESQNE